MNLFNKTRGLSDRLVGRARRARLERRERPFDAMQHYTTVGKYLVGASENTPKGQDYTLTVYEDQDGVLRQALSPVETTDLAPTYIRKFDKRLGRFRAFQNTQTGERYMVHAHLDAFAARVKRH